MFGTRNRRLMYFSMPAGGEELGGDEGGAGGSAPGSNEGVNALGGTTPQTPADNPAWASYLERFPEPVRHIARETFAEWDKNVDQRFQTLNDKYKPYQTFVDQKVSADDLANAWGMAQTLSQDPKGFAQLLAQHVGLTVQEAQQVINKVEGDEGENGEENPPAFEQLQQQLNQLAEYVQAQEQQKQQQAIQQQQEQQIANEFEALEDQYGKMNEDLKNQILREALRMSYETNKPVTMQEAYQSLERFVASIRNVPRPGQNAPRILPNNGSTPAPSPNVSFGKLSPKETRERVAEYVAQINAGS